MKHKYHKNLFYQNFIFTKEINLSIIYFTYIPFDVVKYILFGVLTLYKNTNGENKNPSSTKIEHFSTNVNYFNKKLHRRYCRCPNLNTLGMKFQNLKTYIFSGCQNQSCHIFMFIQRQMLKWVIFTPRNRIYYPLILSLIYKFISSSSCFCLFWRIQT